MASYTLTDAVPIVTGRRIGYLTVPWSEFESLPAKHGGGPSNPASRAAIRAALELEPGTALKVVPHECTLSDHSWGCSIAIAVRNAGIRRGTHFKIRHYDGQLWVGRPPEKKT
jgi:hypothetical protein